MKYIGVDLGSSYIKAALLDIDSGTLADSKSYPSPQREANANPNVFELAAAPYAKTVKGIIDGYTACHGDVEGIIISTQMHGFVYCTPDREDRYISWQDMRCMDKISGTDETYLDKLRGILSPDDMRENGVYLKPSLGACNLYTLLAENPHIAKNGTLYTLGSYIIHSLTGQNVCHISNAAPLGLADVKDRRWNKKVIEAFGLQNIKLPRIADYDAEVCGVYVSNGCKVKVHPDFGDMQVSVMGSHVGRGEVVVNVATAAQVIRYSEAFVPGPYEIRPYFDGAYLYTISNMPAGRNLDVLVRFLCDSMKKITGATVLPAQIWGYVNTHAQHDDELEVEANFYKNPYFPSGGSIKNITHSNLSLETLFTAAAEDMAKTYWHFIKKLCENPDSVERIICAGGVCWKNPQIMSALQGCSKRPCRLSPMANEALGGMYALSLVCSGKCKNTGEAAKYPFNFEE